MMKLKDKKIEILKPDNGRDPEGFNIETLTPIHPGKLWAYFRQLSGKEIHVNAATVPTEDVVFTVNWRGDLTTDCVVRFRGVLYDVVRVDVFEGRKEDVSLYCKRRG
jgi:SPP1 family predicted phage head-tail adaptor